MPKKMHSRDTTVLIDLLWFNVVHYSSLFSTFFNLATIVPILANFLVYCYVQPVQIKKNLYNQSSHYENYKMQCFLQGPPLCLIHIENYQFCGRLDSGAPKGTSRAEAMSNSKKSSLYP